MNFWKKNKKAKNQQRGQGMTEYILLLVVIVAIAGLFRNQIKSAIQGKMDSVSGEINNFNGN